MTDLATRAPAEGFLPLDGWEHPPRRPPSPNAAPVLTVNGFEGPLDWLVDLVRTRQIDLTRLSITALIEAFEQALTAALAVSDRAPTALGRWSGWLVMAAELTLLRSRLLVSVDATAAQEAQDAAEQLRQRLLHRAELTRAADWLQAQSQSGRDVFTRGRTDENGRVRAGRVGDVTALLRACLVAIRLPPDAGELFRVAGPPFWSVSDAAERIRTMLTSIGDEGAALEVFLPKVPPDTPERDLRCRVAVAGTFLAGLELAREGCLEVQQQAPWQAIQVRTPGPVHTVAAGVSP